MVIILWMVTYCNINCEWNVYIYIYIYVGTHLLGYWHVMGHSWICLMNSSNPIPMLIWRNITIRWSPKYGFSPYWTIVFLGGGMHHMNPRFEPNTCHPMMAGNKCAGLSWIVPFAKKTAQSSQQMRTLISMSASTVCHSFVYWLY